MAALDALFKHAFDEGEGAKILTIRETHGDPTSHDFLRQNIPEMKARYGVDKAFLEIPYWFNPLLEAHRQGDITDTELQKYLDGALVDSDADHTFTQIKAMQEQGIEAHAVSTRYATATEMANFEKQQRNNMAPLKMEAYDRALEMAQKYPASFRFDTFIRAAEEKGIPLDAVTAELIRQELGEEGKAVLLYGETHMDGVRFPMIPYYTRLLTGHDPRADGILDDSLEAMGIRITDMQPYTSDLHQERITSNNPSTSYGLISPYCGTGDRKDFIYLTDKDRLLSAEEMKRENRPETCPPEQFPAASTIFSPEELDPQKNAELKQIIDNLRVNYDEIRGDSISGTGARPDISKRGR